MTALFLKYRPQTFSDLVGQEVVRKTLQNALKKEKPSHAYLFCGSRGTGKTSTARIFAKGLNCENKKNGDPCGKCNFCIDTANGSLIDVIEIDAASNRGIDEIRDLREKIKFAPNHAKRKVYIIDEVHMLTKDAFNALLKTLEEPPDHAFFCLATTEMHKIPETILSRCQVFQFERFNLNQLTDRLQKICEIENFTAEKSALDLIGKKAEGGMRDAISLLEQLSAETESQITENAVRNSLGISEKETLEQFYTAISEKNSEMGLDILKNISQKGSDFRTFGHDFLVFLREKMFNNLKTQELKIILLTINEIEKALFRLKTSPIIELPLEIAVINLTSEFKEETINPRSKISKSPTSSKNIKKETKEEKSQSPKNNVEDFLFDEPIAKTKKEESKKIETPSPSNSSSNISIQIITDKMEEIAQSSGIAIFAKKSFLTTIPELKDGKLFFYTDSEFHREKLSNTEVFMKIKKSISNILGEKFEIEFIKKARTNKFKNNSSLTNNEKIDASDFLSF